MLERSSDSELKTLRYLRRNHNLCVKLISSRLSRSRFEIFCIFIFSGVERQRHWSFRVFNLRYNSHLENPLDHIKVLLTSDKYSRQTRANSKCQIQLVAYRETEIAKAVERIIARNSQKNNIIDLAINVSRERNSQQWEVKWNMKRERVKGQS